MLNFSDIIGIIGVAFLLIAYFLHLFKYIEKEHIGYILLNVIGALLAAYASYLIDYYPFVILESTWALVSGYALFQYLRPKD